MRTATTTQRAPLGVPTRLAVAVVAAFAVWFAAAAPHADAAVQRKLGTRLLKLGAKGTDVRVLQYSLYKLQYAATVDGVFGPSTKVAVKAFETKRHLLADGIVPPKEGRKIKAAAKKVPVISNSSERFPILGVHNYGGADAVFGAQRNGHIHQGQDVFAACGTPLVAAHSGYVRANSFQAGGAGYYLVLRSSLTFEDHVYDHMQAPPLVAKGAQVTAGQPIGNVGATGDAVGCHLHFEIWTLPGWYLGGAPYDPKPTLLRWDAYS